MRTYLTGLLVAGAAALAGAADAQTTTDWSGVYVGLNGGWTSGRTRGDSSLTINQLSGVSAGAGPVTVAPITIPDNGGRSSGDGFIGGAQLGFNAQGGGLVWGVEGDIDALSNGRRNRKDTFTLPATALTTGSTVTARTGADARWIASVRARVGSI
jgi:outer membrane immunogenic protein